MKKIKFFSNKNFSLGLKIFFSSIMTGITLILALWFTRWIIIAKNMSVVGLALSIGLLFLYFYTLGFWSRTLFNIRD